MKLINPLSSVIRIYDYKNNYKIKLFFLAILIRIYSLKKWHLLGNKIK